MRNEEAIEVLGLELTKFRDEPYASLVARMSSDCQDCIDQEVMAPTGRKYQVQVQVVWDGPPGGNVRVMGAIDDGGWRAFMPLCRDFIKAPDGSFIGE